MAGQRKYCSGCRDDFYNHGGHAMDGKQCWSLKGATVVTLYRIGWWTAPTEKGAFTKVKTNSCHYAPGQYGITKNYRVSCPNQNRAETRPMTTLRKLVDDWNIRGEHFRIAAKDTVRGDDFSRAFHRGTKTATEVCAGELATTVAQMTCGNCANYEANFVRYPTLTNNPVTCRMREGVWNPRDFCSSFQMRSQPAHTPRPIDTRFESGGSR